jgi:hypothetical protein
LRLSYDQHPLEDSFSAAVWSDHTGNASSKPGAPAAADWAAAAAAFAAACGFLLAADLGVADMIVIYMSIVSASVASGASTSTKPSLQQYIRYLSPLAARKTSSEVLKSTNNDRQIIV